MKILFLVKRSQNYSPYSWGFYSSSGLFNSAQGCVDALRNAGVQAKLVVATDNNDIDREVASYKPSIVIIEALWVVPEKFKILTKLHPTVRWIVRVHSKFAFLASEGVALEWLLAYQKLPHVLVAFNDVHTRKSFQLLTGKKALLLPTCYTPLKPECGLDPTPKGVLNICNFGAIRPLKNQLAQGVAAIQAANSLHKTLYFHINNCRVENKGEEVLRNIRALFAGSAPHQLVEHPWYSRRELRDVLETMTLGMQVSLSETFNIMAADMVSVGLPIVVSSEIPWASWFSLANPNDIEDIAGAIRRVLYLSKFDVNRNVHKLAEYQEHSIRQWLSTLRALKYGKVS